MIYPVVGKYITDMYFISERILKPTSCWLIFGLFATFFYVNMDKIDHIHIYRTIQIISWTPLESRLRTLTIGIFML